MNNSDEKIKKIVAELIQDSSQEEVKSRNLNLLIMEVQKLPGLATSSHPYYLEALNQTWEWLSNNIESFSPSNNSISQSLIKWINGYLYWRIKDLYLRDAKKNLVSLDAPIGKDTEGKTFLDTISETSLNNVNLSLLDVEIARGQKKIKERIGSQLELCIEKDPKDRLKNSYPRNSSKCNCQLLALRLLIKEPPEKISQIAKELEVKYTTVNSHWKRKCQPLLQEIAKNLGYQREQEL